jgi:hypothetical protein
MRTDRREGLNWTVPDWERRETQCSENSAPGGEEEAKGQGSGNRDKELIS